MLAMNFAFLLNEVSDLTICQPVSAVSNYKKKTEKESIQVEPTIYCMELN